MKDPCLPQFRMTRNSSEWFCPRAINGPRKNSTVHPRRADMSNPWLKKNPFMSMWLSGANTVMGSARAQVNAAAKREASKASAAAATAAAQQVAEFWSHTLPKPPAAVPRKRRKPR